MRTEGSRDMDKPFSSLANTSSDRQRHEDFYVLEIASRTLLLYVTDLYYTEKYFRNCYGYLVGCYFVALRSLAGQSYGKG